MRLAIFLFTATVALAQSPPKLSLTFIDITKAESSFTSRQLLAGNATIPIKSGEITSQKFQASLTSFRPDPDNARHGALSWTVRVSPETGEIPQWSMSSLQLVLTGQPEPGSYTGVLTVKDPDDTKKLPPLQRQIRIVVPNPEVLVSKLSTVFVRWFPLCDHFYSRQILLPIRSGTGLSHEERVVGALHGSLGGWTKVRWKNPTGESPTQLEVDPPPGAGTYEGDLALGDDLSKPSLTLTVLVQDLILWPIATIVCGVALAFYVKRYLGVIRVVWALREQEAELGELYKKSESIFRAAAVARPFQGFTIEKDVKSRCSAIQTSIAALASPFSTSIAETDPKYLDVVKQVTELSDGLN